MDPATQSAQVVANELLSLPVLAALGLLATTILGALAAAVVSIIRALHEMSVVTGKIETSVNSEKTAAIGRENSLKRENELLREMIADKKVTAGLLAQAVAQRQREVPPAPTDPMPVEIVTTTGPVSVAVVPMTDDPKTGQ